MRAFRRSTSTRSANIPSSIEEDEGVCQNFQDRKLPDKSSCTIGLLVLPDEWESSPFHVTWSKSPWCDQISYNESNNDPPSLLSWVLYSQGLRSQFGSLSKERGSSFSGMIYHDHSMSVLTSDNIEDLQKGGKSFLAMDLCSNSVIFRIQDYYIFLYIL